MLALTLSGLKRPLLARSKNKKLTDRNELIKLSCDDKVYSYLVQQF